MDGPTGGPRRPAAHRLVVRRTPAGRRMLLVAPAVVAVGAMGLLGFVAPGFLVTKVFDPAALRDGVRTVLERDFGLGRVTEVECPPAQRVGPGERFDCTVRIDGVTAAVPVEVQDVSGRYTVGRPT